MTWEISVFFTETLNIGPLMHTEKVEFTPLCHANKQEFLVTSFPLSMSHSVVPVMATFLDSWQLQTYEQGTG